MIMNASNLGESLEGYPTHHGLHQTGFAVVDVSSAEIEAGEPILFSKMSANKKEIIATSFKSGSGKVLGIALGKLSIPLGEDLNYKAFEMVPFRKFGEVMVKVEGTVALGDDIKVASSKLIAGAGDGVKIGVALGEKDASGLVRVSISLSNTEVKGTGVQQAPPRQTSGGNS